MLKKMQLETEYLKNKKTRLETTFPENKKGKLKSFPFLINQFGITS